METTLMDKQFEDAVAAVVPSQGVARRLYHSITTVFRGVPLRGANVLDVGGGAGFHSLYAAVNGATKVVCLEPGAEGSRAEYGSPNQLPSNGANETSVQFLPLMIQEFDPGLERFDVILLHNSVNHLDEQACIMLPCDFESLESYTRIFEKLADLANEGALIIITDCSSKNFFGLIRIRNPFAPTIEWNKHHQPSLWAGLLEHAGFTDSTTEWIVPQRLGSVGQKLFGNQVCAFFLSSYFRLTACKEAKGAPDG